MFKKIISTAVAFTLAAGLVCPQFLNAGVALTSFAEEEKPTSGFCGAEDNEENVTWSFDVTTGTLTISGEGEMTDHSSPWDNYDITEIIIENGVTSIGNWAFNECSNLTSVTIPDSVTSIGSEAFSGCSSLTSVRIPNSVTDIRGRAFEGTPWLDAQLEASPFVIAGKVVFDSNPNICVGDIVIPDGITSIGGCAFEYCSGLISVTISDSVTDIGSGAFSGCNNLTSVTIPDSVTSIGMEAFEFCDSLISVTIPSSVTSIGWCAFSICSSLESVTIENPDCEIIDSDKGTTISNGWDGDFYFTGTIYGYIGSTAQEYANEHSYKFDDISNAPVNSGSGLGDIDGSGSIDSSDASIALQEYALLATGQKGNLNASQTKAADVNADGSVDSSDASTILRYYAYTATGGKDPFDVFLKI